MNQSQFNRSKYSELMTFDEYKELVILHENWFKSVYPSVKYIPDLKVYLKASKPSNLLTKLIIHSLRWNGYFAERINSMGVFRDGRYTFGGGMTGTADISAIIKGKAVRIEVKIKDKQSEAQKIYQQKIEKSGAEYWLIYNYSQFKIKLNELLSKN